MRDGTGQDLIRFWDWVVEKGLVKQATANARKTAVAEVLDVLGQDTSLDIRQMDIEDALRRFENLKSAKYAPRSLSTYKSRFRKAVAEYLAYLDNPSGWRPDIKPRALRGKKTAVPTSSGTRVRGRSDDNPQEPVAASAAHPGGGGPRLIDYPFPVREGVVAVLKLPMDLRSSEARRLASFLSALAMPDQKEDEPSS
jgi:hypothetical protein